jgi:hypothetical protein
MKHPQESRIRLHHRSYDTSPTAELVHRTSRLSISIVYRSAGRFLSIIGEIAFTRCDLLVGRIIVMCNIICTGTITGKRCSSYIRSGAAIRLEPNLFDSKLISFAPSINDALPAFSTLGCFLLLSLIVVKRGAAVRSPNMPHRPWFDRPIADYSALLDQT